MAPECVNLKNKLQPPLGLSDHRAGPVHAHLVSQGTTLPKRTANSLGSKAGLNKTQRLAHAILRVTMEMTFPPFTETDNIGVHMQEMEMQKFKLDSTCTHTHTPPICFSFLK